MSRPPPPPVVRLAGALLDLVYPRRCGGCTRLGAWLCADCLAALAPPDPPGWTCATCAQPLLPGAAGLYCPDLCDTGGLSAVLGAGAYQGPLREAIHHLKYSGWRVLAPSLAALLAATCAGTPLPWGPGAVPHLVPVPLHPRRQRERGFNQSALLAQRLGAQLGWPLLAGLARIRNTPHQVGLPGAERALNLEDAFAWRGPAPPPPGPLILVDDVYTTGATLQAGAAALRAAGAGAVYGVVLARRGSSDATLQS